MKTVEIPIAKKSIDHKIWRRVLTCVPTDQLELEILTLQKKLKKTKFFPTAYFHDPNKIINLYRDWYAYMIELD